jgi:hypothetical protein
MKIHPEKPIDERHLPDEYRRLLGEVDRLKEENRQLKARLQLLDTKDSNYFNPKSNTEKSCLVAEASECFSSSFICNTSDSTDKIRLFKALFKGREDVYTKRWENKKKNISGYSPVCLNEWSVGICSKPKNARNEAVKAALANDTTEASVKTKMDVVVKIMGEIAILQYSKGFKTLVKEVGDDQKNQLTDNILMGYSEIFGAPIRLE